MADKTQTTMSVGAAADALSNLAYDFHNQMIREGTKELRPEQWLEAFLSWLPSGIEFARKHYETVKWLAEVDRAKVPHG